MVNINSLKRYFSNGEPCPYKLNFGNTILLYPIKVLDYEEFEICVDILKVNKDIYNDANIISMSQLEFLATKIFSNKTIIEGTKTTIGCNEELKLKTIFKLCLDEDYIMVGTDHNGKYIIGVYNFLEDENIYELKYTISNKEFIEISKIILFQNFYDYDDEEVSQDVLEEYQKYLEIKNKNIEHPSFERMKVFLMSRHHCNLDEVNNMTYRLFSMLINEYIDKEIYFVDNMYKTAYKYDVKESVEYPLYKKKQDKFKDLFMSEQALNNKLGNNN